MHGGDGVRVGPKVRHRRRVLRLRRDVLQQKYRGREEVHQAGIASCRQAEDQVGGEGGYQIVQADGQEVENEIQHRQGEYVAHDEGYQRGAGKVEDALAGHGQHRHPQAHRVEPAAKQAQKHRQKPRHRAGDADHHQPRQGVGHEQTLPPDGQGVHQPHAAAVVEIAPHRHGAQHGVAQHHDGHRVGHYLVIVGGELQGRHGHPVAQPLGQHGQRKQGAAEGGHAPQRPKPAQVLAKERGVKEGCL